MNRRTIIVLITLNVLFAFILAAEWIANEETVVTISKAKTENSESEEAFPALDLTATSEESYSDLVERPMFIKGRKPVEEPEPESVPVAEIKKTEVFVWDVAGIFKTPKGVTAFFSRTNTKVPRDNYRKYKVGEELDGWKISEIHPDKVILTQATETKTLPLRKLKPKSSIPVQMNANNRIPPQQQPPVQPQLQMQQQGMPPQNVQQPEMIQNNAENPDDQSVESVQE